jgi:hypothetical protein
MEAVIRARMPRGADPRKRPVELRDLEVTKGWLADIRTGEIAAYRAFPGRKPDASWFPTRKVAQAWVRYSRAVGKAG